MLHIPIKLYQLHNISLPKSELGCPQPQKAGEHLGRAEAGEAKGPGKARDCSLCKE